MSILYRLKKATVAEVQTEIDDRLHYSTVRALLRVLEKKGHIRHYERQLKYVYIPVVPRKRAAESALMHVLETFFENSAEQLLAALLRNVPAEQLDDLFKMMWTNRKPGQPGKSLALGLLAVGSARRLKRTPLC
jgi:BlaI family transcriptional regulator, penicillinase repressor